jgi:VWFA-related protein
VTLGLAAPALSGTADVPPVFGTRADLVVVDLVVRDRHGNLIRDLRLDEVEVYEDDVPQTAVGFRSLAPPPAATGATPLTPLAAHLADAATPSATASHRVNLVALVFDQLSVDGRALARKAAHDFLAARPDAEAYFAVFRIDGRLELAQGFTRDVDVLERAVEAATLGRASAFASSLTAMGGAVGASRNSGDPLQRGYDPRELRPAHFAGDPEAGSPMDGDGPLTPERKMANVTLDILRTAEEAERTQRGNWSLDGLVSVVHGLRTLPGRKTLVHFSEGLHIPPGLEDPLRSLVSEANRASVSIYGVDVRGLGTAGRMAEAREMLDQAVAISQSQRLSGSNWHGVTREQARQFETVEATLRVDARGNMDDLARSTGGFLIADSNDMKRGLTRLGEDLGHYYEVAYAPRDRRADGRFRRLSVKVGRRGASVQSRSGYFAVPHRLGEPVYGFEGPLLVALASPRPPRKVEHRAAVFRFEADAGAVRHALALAVPLAHVTFVRDAAAGRYAGRVSVLALVRDAAGDVVEKLSRDYLLEGPLGDLEATRRTRITFTRPFRVPPGAYSVDTAVRDGFGEKTGCGRLPLAVATPSPGVRLSSVVPLAAIAPASAGEDGADPFRVGDVRMTPALGASLSSGAPEPLVLYYVVYPPVTGAGAPEARLEVGRGDRVFKRGAVELPPPDARGRIPHVARVPLGALAPGEYTVRLSVSQGASRATEETLVRVVEEGR